MNKRCSRCRRTKLLISFSDHPAMEQGKQSQCKDCIAERARIKRVGRPCEGCKLALPLNTKKSARRCDSCLSKCIKCGKQGRLKNQRICCACQKETDATRKASVEFKFASRISKIVTVYKVRRALAACLAVTAKCEACDKSFTRKGDQHIDHCHLTGDVRGVLCFNCNAALGHLKDDVVRLENLTKYLKNKTAFMVQSDLIKARYFINQLIELEEKKANGR